MRTLSTEQLTMMRKGSDQQLTVINTLDEENFEKTKIPESINIPLESNDFLQRVEQAAGGKEMPVVVYCASDECDSSTKAAQKLEENGFSNVYEYEGGSKAWKEAGGKVGAAVS